MLLTRPEIKLASLASIDVESCVCGSPALQGPRKEAQSEWGQRGRVPHFRPVLPEVGILMKHHSYHRL